MNLEYNKGRFFVSPIIGCAGRCIYCYLPRCGVKKETRTNTIKIDKMIVDITANSNFIKGSKGSIISVGAWGDIFSNNNEEELRFSIEWIIELLKIGNPVQIMSKFDVEEHYVNKICKYIQYEGQLLYSTTVTTFNEWNKVECNTSSPLERLETLMLFKKNNVPTNVMIKPYIPGITDNEIDLFEYYLKKYEVDYCVVGILYWTNEMLNKLSRYDGITLKLDKYRNSSFAQVLDCSGDVKMHAFSSKNLDDFVIELRKRGINVFKKSSCVNSNILNIRNVSEYYKNDPNNFCIKCGNC